MSKWYTLITIIIITATIKSYGQVKQKSQDPDLPENANISKKDYLKARENYHNLKRGLPHKLSYDPRLKAIEQMKQQQKAMAGRRTTSQTSAWTELGPSPIVNGQTFNVSIPVSGRVTAIAIHPTNPDIVYVGTANGGIFRTLNGGASWTAIFDQAVSLSIGALALAPSDPSILYVGTGDNDNLIAGSVGLYRIDNANSSPSLVGPINPTFGFTLVGGNNILLTSFRSNIITKILVNPSDPATIFISTSNGDGNIMSGVFRSTNATSSPHLVRFKKLTVTTANSLDVPATGSRNVSDIMMIPGNPNGLICSVSGNYSPGDGGIYKTTNALDPDPLFTQVYIGGGGCLGASSTPDIMYAALGEGSGTVRKSIDGGNNWFELSGPQGFCGSQCWFDIAIGVSPSNPNKFILGGQFADDNSTSAIVKTSTDGGSTFFNSQIGLHADTHVVLFAPSNENIVYTGSDGGIFKSIDGGLNWVSLNRNGFSATQYESIALHPIDPNFTIGGTQDNGTVMEKPDGSFFRIDWGDGGYALIDQNANDNDNVTMYHTFYNFSGFLGYARNNNVSTATEGNWSFFGCDGISRNGISCSDNTLFYAPMTLGPGNPNTVYFGTNKLYRSSDKGLTNLIVSQQPISNGVISSIAVSKQNDNIRIVGLTNGQVWATSTGSSVLNNITPSFSPPLGGSMFVGRVAIDPNNSNIAYVCYSAYGVAVNEHIWKTTNLSDIVPTWKAIGSGIPDIPVLSFAVDPFDSNILYAGTDIGVYQSIDGGGSWIPFNLGLPFVPVFDMAIHPISRTLKIATFGRGLWSTKLNCSNINVINPDIASGVINLPLGNLNFNQSGGFNPTIYTTNSPLPSGVNLFNSGLLTGTPTQLGVFPIIVKATDINGCTGIETTYNLTINNSCPLINVINPSTSSGLLRTAFNQVFTSTGGTFPIVFSTANTLPSGMSLSTSGILSGTPTETGSFPLAVFATDMNGCHGTGTTYNLVISCPSITVSNPSIVSGNYGVPFSQSFTSSGGIAPVTFSTSSSLPLGLSLSTSGLLSGIPNQTGSFPIVVSATDVNGCQGTGAIYNLVINNCPVVTVNSVNNQVVCAGASTFPVTFSGSPAGTIFKWKNNHTSIGLAFKGTGNIASFTAINVGSLPVVSTITVTPSYTSGGITCTGTSITFTITVNPPDVIATPSTQSICSGSPIANIHLTGTTNGATFTWTRDNTDVTNGISASGSGDITGILTNTTNLPVTVTFTITPNPDNCPGIIRTASVIVNPISELVTPSNQTLCNNDNSPIINLSSSVTGTVYNWVNNLPSIGLASSGTGNIASFKALNKGNVPVTATLSVTGITSGDFAYVPNFSSNSVSLINLATNALLTNIKVGSRPLAVSVNQDGKNVYVTNYVSGTVSVINASSNIVIATVPVGLNPAGVVVNINGLVYVTNEGSNSVSVINSTTNSVTATIAIGDAPEGIAISPDGSHVYVANYGSNTLTVINTTSNTVETTINVGTNPEGVAISADGQRIYVTNEGSSDVSVIDGTTNSVIANVPVGISPEGITVSLDGNRIYVANNGSDNISVVNTVSNIVETTIDAGINSFPYGISISLDGSRIYIANLNTNNVSVINTSTNAIEGTVQVGNAPFALGNFITHTNLCPSTPKDFTITVNPSPNAIPIISSQTVCSANAISPITFSGNVSGTIFNWLRDNTNSVSGINASGSGNISGSLYNVTNAPITVTFTITPTANGCSGTPVIVTVIVNPDHENPSIIAPEAINTTTNSGCIANGVLLGTPITNDNCGVASISNDAPVIFPVGTTTVTWIVTDKSGNSATATQLVTVTDNVKPTITKPSNITVSNSSGNCRANVILQTPAISDNCSVATVINDHPSTLYPVGITTVTWTVTDTHGNTNTTSQTVTIVDAESPKITCPTIAVQCFNTTGVYNIPTLIATDNCGIVSISYSISGATIRSGLGSNASGTFNPGQSSITWIVSDAAGNATTCTTIVNINPRIIASIPDVYAVSPGGNANTIYIGYGPASVSLNANVNGGTKPYAYKWTIGSSAGAPLNTSATYTVNPTTTTIYYLNIKDAYGCPIASITKTINVIDVRCGNKLDKITVCTLAKGNYTTNCVSTKDVTSYLSNGSYLGVCNPSLIASVKSFTFNQQSSISLKNSLINLFEVQALPNPTGTKFKLKVESNLLDPITIRILDVTGRQIQIINYVFRGQIVSVGNNYRAGTYFAEIIQRTNHKTIKLIKIN